MAKDRKKATLKPPRTAPRKASGSVPVKPGRQRAKNNLTLESFMKLDRSAVIFLIFMVCLTNWTIRVLIAPVYTVEEADQLLMSQSFHFGYEARQPPMIAWICALATKAAGVSPPVVFGVKYVLLWVALTFYYLSARNVLSKPGVSAAAVGAWALTFYIGWGVHEDLFGAVALMACLSLTLHALSRILAWRRNRDWTYLGISIGLGLLTHHLYIVFPMAMIAAIFLSPFFRDAVKPIRLIVALAIAAAMYAPYAIWLLAHFDRIAVVAGEFARSYEIDSGWLARVGQGGVSLARGLFEFTLPLSLFWATLFWTLWLPVLYPIFARRSTDEEAHEEAFRKLFARAMLVAAAIYLIGVIIGVQVYKGWWM
ncbi:MAG: glycosyltransferase family 39 protein, partial [Alphaproteobacteria bacterium]